jgi:scyllo-inositol 2-dehydrogenase (NADP+)
MSLQPALPPGLQPGSSLQPASQVASTASPSSGSARVPIGLIGLDRSGLFHAERLSLRSDIAIVAACDPLTSEPPPPSPRLPGPHAADPRVYFRLEDLCSRTDFTTVLIAGPIDRRAEWAAQAIASGKDVVLDALPCPHADTLRELLAAAARTGRHVLVLPTRRGGTDFRTALEVVRGARLGNLYSARLLSWAKAVPHAAGSSVSRSRTEPDPFSFFAYQYVDQLLQLIGQPPRSVFARILPPAPREPASTAFTLAIGFEPGVDALVDVNLQSGAVLETGWMLAGARGGYGGGRIFLEEASGEICDAPVSQSDLPEIDVYGELLERARGEPGATASARDAERVLRVIDAARESSRTGNAVSIESAVSIEPPVSIEP